MTARRQVPTWAGAGLAIVAGLAGGALLTVAARAATPLAIPTHAGSPPALSREAVARQPEYQDSMAHYLALKAKAKPPRRPLPDWTGLWLNEQPFAFDPGYPFAVATTAPLAPQYASTYKQVLDKAAKGREWDPLSECLPAGYPRMWAENHPFDFVVTPHQVWILAELMNEAHRVYTDGRSHRSAEDAYPLWDGDAIGFWDDDTLIVHTDNLMPTVSGYQRNGPVMSASASTVEQWRMVDQDTIVLQIVVYDPKVLTGPWRVAPRTFKRVHGDALRAEFYDCAGTSRVAKTADGGTRILLPGEEGFDASGPPKQ